MKKLYCIGLCAAMFISTTAFSMSANEDISSGTIQLDPKFKQIQDGDFLVVEATVTNTDDDNKVVCTLTQKDENAVLGIF